MKKKHFVSPGRQGVGKVSGKSKTNLKILTNLAHLMSYFKKRPAFEKEKQLLI